MELLVGFFIGWHFPAVALGMILGGVVIGIFQLLAFLTSPIWHETPSKPTAELLAFYQGHRADPVGFFLAWLFGPLLRPLRRLWLWCCETGSGREQRLRRKFEAYQESLPY
jgi:hypothetical protein